MKTSEQGIKLIKEFEGFRSEPYLDSAGVPTIGYGSTFYANGQRVTMSDSYITEAEASRLKSKVLTKFENGVNESVQVELNQNQFDALVSLAYNIGVSAFSNSTLVKRLNAGMYKEAANQFLLWRIAGGQVLAGLEKRRKQERKLFLTEVQPQEKKSMSKILQGYKTYIGIAITMLGSLSSLFGWELGDLAGLQDQIISIVGALIAIYGRYVAKSND